MNTQSPFKALSSTIPLASSSKKIQKIKVKTPGIESKIKINSPLPELSESCYNYEYNIGNTINTNLKDLPTAPKIIVFCLYKIVNCKICGNIDTVNPCSICQDKKRDINLLCVVEDISDLWTFERTGFYKGYYHVLGGVLSAINGIGLEELNIEKLVKRLKESKSKEVILALGATMEGQTTSHVIAEKIESFNVDVTRLAQGVPIGGEVHYLDENTLNAAFQSRKKI